MKTLHSLGCTMLLAACAFQASAQSLKPGLWEISTKMSSDSGKLEKAMTEMNKQMASMSPEQRKMMEGMLSKQGISMGSGQTGATIKICMSKEMAENNDVAHYKSAGAAKDSCTHTMSPRVGNSMKFSFSCSQPPSSGEGTVTFNGTDSYTSNVVTKSTNAQGKPETMTMDSSAKYLSSDCGSIKPLVVPKQ